MNITGIDIHLIRVPFDMGAPPRAFAGMNWTSVDSLFADGPGLGLEPDMDVINRYRLGETVRVRGGY